MRHFQYSDTGQLFHIMVLSYRLNLTCFIQINILQINSQHKIIIVFMYDYLVLQFPNQIELQHDPQQLPFPSEVLHLGLEFLQWKQNGEELSLCQAYKQSPPEFLCLQCSGILMKKADLLVYMYIYFHLKICAFI